MGPRAVLHEQSDWPNEEMQVGQDGGQRQELPIPVVGRQKGLQAFAQLPVILTQHKRVEQPLQGMNLLLVLEKAMTQEAGHGTAAQAAIDCLSASLRDATSEHIPGQQEAGIQHALAAQDSCLFPNRRPMKFGKGMELCGDRTDICQLDKVDTFGGIDTEDQEGFFRPKLKHRCVGQRNRLQMLPPAPRRGKRAVRRSAKPPVQVQIDSAVGTDQVVFAFVLLDRDESLREKYLPRLVQVRWSNQDVEVTRMAQGEAAEGFSVFTREFAKKLL
jgi:hypothetical protein